MWDEAFYPLATGAWTRGDADRGARRRLAHQALRLPGPAPRLRDRPGPRRGRRASGPASPQWSVGDPGCAALPELLALVDLPGWRDEVAALREQLADVLRSHGFAPRPSAANWLLVDAPELRDQLAPHAIAVRDCASFGMPGVVRVAVPDAIGLERLAAALATIEPADPPEQS